MKLEGNGITLNDFRKEVVLNTYWKLKEINSDILIPNNSLKMEDIRNLKYIALSYSPNLNTVSFDSLDEPLFNNPNTKETLVCQEAFLELAKPNGFYNELMN